MARSMIRSATFGAATLMALISTAAALLPTVSIIHAVFSVSSRTISRSMRDSAIQSMMLLRSAIRLPNVVRDSARLHSSSSARSAAPIDRMQWWMRPGPSRAWLMANPSPSSAIMLLAGTRQFSNRSSTWPSGST